MDNNRWFESERYQELTGATRAMDYARQIQIFEEAIAETEGAEQAFWLRLRAERRLQQYTNPKEAVRGWEELPVLLAATPDDPDHLAQVARFAQLLYGASQRADMWSRFFPQIRRGVKVLRHDWVWHLNLAEIRRLERRPYSCLRACTKTLALLDALPPAVRETQRGRPFFIYGRRARAAVALGRLNLAAEDIQRAADIAAQFVRGYFGPYEFALAQAELALARRQFDVARLFLNEGVAGVAINPFKPDAYQQVEFDLVAARIARAEGNMTSFRHFANRALATCVEWDLRLSEATVRAVMAGAER